MGYFSHGFVFTKEPNWQSIARRPVAMQGYQHKTKSLWLLEVSSRSIDKRNPFGEFVTDSKFKWSSKREQKKLPAKTLETINRLGQLEGCLGSKRKGIYFDIGRLQFGSQIAQLAEVPCYYYAGNDESLDLGVNFQNAEIESLGFRVCDMPLVVKFSKDKFSILVDRKGLDSQTEQTSFPLLLAALKKWKKYKDVTVKDATRTELKLFGFYSIAANQWPKAAGSPKAALGIGTWDLYSNLSPDYKVVATRKTPLAKLTGKSISGKPSKAVDSKPFEFKKFELPKGFFFAGGTSTEWIFSKCGRGSKQGVAGETIVCDLKKWPPKVKAIAKEYVLRADCSRKGTWAFSTAALQDKKRGIVFEARIRDSLGKKFRTLESGEHFESGILQALLLGDCTVAEPASSPTNPSRSPLVETDGLLKEAEYMPNSRELTMTSGIVRLFGGKDVFIWAGKGYEMKRNKLTKTFDLHSDSTSAGYVPLSKESFLYAAKGKLYRAQRNKKPVRCFSKPSHVWRISTGPDNSVIVQDLDRYGDVAGFVLFPKDDSYIRLENRLLPKTVHYQPNGLIRWVPECNKIVFITWTSSGMRMFAIEADDVMQQPRWNAKTNKIKK